MESLTPYITGLGPTNQNDLGVRPKGKRYKEWHMKNESYESYGY